MGLDASNASSLADEACPKSEIDALKKRDRSDLDDGATNVRDLRAIVDRECETMPRLKVKRRARVRFRPDADEVLATAVDEAREENHAFVGGLHLLWALLFDARVRAVLERASVDLARLDETLDLELRADAKLVEGGTARLDADFDHTVRKAGTYALGAGRKDIGVLDLLGALCREARAATALLARLGVAPIDVLFSLAHALSPAEARAKMTPPIPLTSAPWIVTLHNDDYTTQVFVVALLTDLFGMRLEEARARMQTVHEQGQVAIGTYPATEVAKLLPEAMRLAREADMPFLVTARAAVETYR